MDVKSLTEGPSATEAQREAQARFWRTGVDCWIDMQGENLRILVFKKGTTEVERTILFDSTGKEIA